MNERFDTLSWLMTPVWRPLGIAVAAILVTACVAASSDAGNTTILRGTVIDGTDEPPIEDGVVVIEGERVRCVGRLPECTLPSDARTIAVDGTIMPGLIDLHVHSRPAYLPMFLAAGVTTVRDANNSLETVGELEATGPVRPRLHAAGPMLVGNEGSIAELPTAVHASEAAVQSAMPLIVRDAEEGRSAVDSLTGNGVSVIKLYEFLPPDAFSAIIQRADQLDVPTMGDIGMQLTNGLRGTQVDASQAIEAGIGTIEHMSGFALAYRRLGGDPAADTYDPDLIDRLAHEILDGSTMLVPTLISMVQFSSESPSLGDVPLADRTKEYFRTEWMRRHPLPPPMHEAATADLRLTRTLLRRVIELGGADYILAGTDTPNPYVTPGGSLHQELELLVEIGLSPHEAIRSATERAAVELHRDDIGVLARGNLADIVVVDGDPLADIRATRNVHTVLLGGQLIDRGRVMDDVEARLSAGRDTADDLTGASQD